MITDFKKLLYETALVFDVTPDAIIAKGRKAEIALARQVVMAIWSDHHSFQDAANRVNRTSHQTAMHARERIINRAELDPNFARIVAGIAARCQHPNPSDSTSLESEPLEKSA